MCSVTPEFIIQGSNNSHGSNILIEIRVFSRLNAEFLAHFKRMLSKKRKKVLVDVLVYLRLLRMSAAAAAIMIMTAAAIAM